MHARVLVLGSGHAGTAIAESARARGLEVTVTARSQASVDALAARGLAARRFDLAGDGAHDDIEALARVVDEHTLVAVCFPPDGRTDAAIAPHLAHAGALRYLSSTSVYGATTGTIDESVPVPPPERPQTKTLLEAEETWRSVGATVFRCAAIYGPTRGLHVRVVSGKHQIPGDGRRWLSRIHVEDIAQHVLSPVTARGETFVLGDQEPALHGDVVQFIAEQYGVPVPPSVPLESVHPTLRADRRVDGSRARQLLGVVLRYPSYREGMAPSVTSVRAETEAAASR